MTTTRASIPGCWKLLATALLFAPFACLQYAGAQAAHDSQASAGGPYQGVSLYEWRDRVAPMASASPSLSALEEALRAFIDAQTAGFAGRVKISMGSLNPRLTLAPCAAVEPFMPAGTRLWGRASLGLRCREGARWSVLIPVHIQIFAPALVASRALRPGQELTTEDYELTETELTREAPGILTGATEIANQVLARPVPSGTALRREHFRARPVAAPGDQVRLIYIGPGFSVSSSGKLLQAASEGQSVRVQVESGRILSGIARAGKTVEVAF